CSSIRRRSISSKSRSVIRFRRWGTNSKSHCHQLGHCFDATRHVYSSLAHFQDGRWKARADRQPLRSTRRTASPLARPHEVSDSPSAPASPRPETPPPLRRCPLKTQDSPRGCRAALSVTSKLPTQLPAASPRLETLPRGSRQLE